MRRSLLFVFSIVLLAAASAPAQLVDEFNPPRANCCLPEQRQDARRSASGLEPAWPVSRGQPGVEEAAGRPQAGGFHGRFHHHRLEPGHVLPGQAVRQPRHQRPDHAADAGAHVPRRDRPQARRHGGAGGHQRRGAQHRAGDGGDDRGEPHGHDGAGPGPRHQGDSVLGDAGERLSLPERAAEPAGRAWQRALRACPAAAAE